KRPTHAMSLETKRRIIEKYQSYGDLRPNVVHFCELLAEEENITYSDTTVRKLLYQAGFLSPKTQRATKRRLKQEAKQKKREAEK
ncbi:ISNCY family transposase, partial [Streptococcus equi subsp. zooepidemicus]|nr:ISNCY family transposase [Streptococcus equi subsp. zooepidemicus]MDI5953350.1 ISNCY family transposase [Streptococcus equi subsp. zooepidemicus]MDI6077016.1 ISNCY family transposase [Streptococcus equi subsp. zooepidemicus]